MKRLVKYSLIISCAFFVNHLFSQNYLGFSTGYKLNYPSNNTWNYSIDISEPGNFFISLDYRTSKQKHFSVGAKFFYEFQNTDLTIRESYHMASSRTEANMKFGYFEVFIFPEFNFGEKAIFYMNIGPCLGFLTNSSMYGTEYWSQGYPPLSGMTELSSNADKYLRSITISLQLGTGLKYPINEKLSLKLDVSNRIGNPYLEDQSFMYNLMFSVGTEFRVGKR